jgi:hypothetical protein
MTNAPAEQPEIVDEPSEPVTDQKPDGSTRADEVADWNLEPLTPSYIAAEHAGYVAAIIKALKNPKIRNIALSGNYGVGKSSVLQKVSELLESEPGRKRDRVVELSLSTLAPIERSTIDESIPVQATTPTNRIQQEIVKQLLYREEPKKSPGSRFRRIEWFNWRRELGVAVLGGFMAAVIFMIFGWGKTIVTTIAPLFDFGLYIYPILLILVAGAIFISRALLHGRVHIRQFSAGPASVTLDENSVSYFDQYLDEIVYFFETSKRDVVIFEDIDRFNDSHIFETLRSLNTLLNASPQIEDPIRFIYAIKDSIFDRIGLETEGRKSDATIADLKDPAEAESVRANRTKFFDLVIPVVPFITHRSARNLTAQILRGIDHEVSNDLIDLAGRYVPDMRLLKNVRNEFVVFRDRIFSGDGQELELSETQLFAMMLYKSTHLADFELIRLGRSALDKLYEIYRKLIGANIRLIEREALATRQELARANSATARSARLGDRLIEQFDLMVRVMGLQPVNQQYLVGQVVKTAADLKGVAFWQEMATGSTGVSWRNPNYGGSFSFTRADVAKLVGDPLDVDAWETADRKALQAAQDEQTEQLKFLRSADMGELMKRPEFLVDFEGTAQSLESVAEKLLGRGLAFQLVRAGYIDRNFTQYTSTFHGDRVSPAATNFIILHVERDSMDEHFELTDDDVDSVIRERGRDALKEPALFNIAILDHLLRSDETAAALMVQSLARFDAEANRFLQSYLSSGEEQPRLLKALVKRAPKVLTYLISEVELDDAKRLDLVSHALASLVPNVSYGVDGDTSEYFGAHYLELPTLLSETLGSQQAKRIATIFADGGIRVPQLAPLAATVREAFIDEDLYEMNLANLKAAAGENASLALDALRSHNEKVYSKALRELAAYLDAIEGTAATNDDEAGFAHVLTDVFESEPGLVDKVISGASPSSQIADLASVPEATWPPLARAHRFPTNFQNVNTYIAQLGPIDSDLASALKASEVISVDGSEAQTDRIALAQTILGSRDVLSSALRADLVASLELEEHLSVAGIAAEQGALFAHLLDKDLIADDDVTFAHLVATNWATREGILAASATTKDMVTPAFVGADLAPLLSSGRVAPGVKSAIVARASEFVATADRPGTAALAAFAVSSGAPIDLAVLEVMVMNGAAAKDVVALLQPHLSTIANDRLFTVLLALGGDFPQLRSVGRDKPKVRNTPGVVELLEHLKTLLIVKTFDPNEDPIKVNKRYK